MKSSILNILLLLTFPSNLLLAQHDFKPGFVILHNGDTLKGEIDNRNDISLNSSCTFRISKDSEKAIFTPDSIIGFRFEDSKYFVSKEIQTKTGSKKAFLEYLVKGKLDVYFCQDEEGSHYFIEKVDRKLTELPYKTNIVFKNGTRYLEKSNAHYGILNLYLSDAPNMYEKIKYIEEPDHTNLIKLAKNYHQALCNETQCIVYEKKEASIRIYPEILAGVIQYSGSEISNTTYFHAGAFLHICIPKASEKLFFRTGVSTSTVTADLRNFDEILEKAQVSIYKIPLHLEYMFPGKVFKPSFSYGVNFYAPIMETFSSTLSFNLGLRIKVYKKWHLSIGADLECYQKQPFLIIPEKLLSRSLMTGLFYQF